MYVWMKVSKDKYELPLVVANTSEELAKMCGTTANSIMSSIAHAKRKGQRSSFVRIKIENE